MSTNVVMILVVGATGTLCGRIASNLLAACNEVRILIRHNSSSAELVKIGMATSASVLIDAGAQLVYGDLKDRMTLDGACASVDMVIITVARYRVKSTILESFARVAHGASV